LEQGGGVRGQKIYYPQAVTEHLPSLVDALERCQATEEPFEADCFDCTTVTQYDKSARIPF